MWTTFLCWIGWHQWHYQDRPHLAGRRIGSPLPPMPMSSLRQCARCGLTHTYSAYLGEWGL